jgi:hypothetical protein
MKRIMLSGLMVFFLFAGLCPGREEPSALHSIAIFKNGLGFAVRTAKLDLTQGWGEIAFVPDSTLGSFWLFPQTPQAYVESARVGWRKQQQERECLALVDLLKANAGAKVRLHLLVNQPDLALEGELLAMPTPAGEAEGVVPLVRLKTRGGSVMTLPLETVRFIEWLGDYAHRFAEEKTSKVLQVKVRNGSDSESLHLVYLTRGVSWLPGYWLDVRDAEKARIILKATLLNDLEDFQDLSVDFVVGYPNFAFSRLASPMNLEEDVERFLSRLAGRAADSNAMANITTQALGRNAWQVDGSDQTGMETGPDIGAAGQGEEDLFFFNQKQISLRKGERAEYTIFSAHVPYEHVFECSLSDISGIDEWGNRRQQDGRERGNRLPVWHCLKLTNTTPYPWTTGPALVMKGDAPLAQNQLNYLARGAAGLLRLTYAPDISVQQGEDETSRRDDVVINRSRYTEVQVQGTVSLRNHKNEPVKMEVSKTLSGAVLSASDAAKTSRLTDEIRGINPQSLIRWSFTLAAGAARKLTYAYKIYVD